MCFCLLPSSIPSNNKSFQQAPARKPRINLRNIQGMRKRPRNGHCINLSAQLYYYCNPDVKKPSSRSTMLPAVPPGRLGQGVIPSMGMVGAASAVPRQCYYAHPLNHFVASPVWTEHVFPLFGGTEMRYLSTSIT